jgi:hypothetical protein
VPTQAQRKVTKDRAQGMNECKWIAWICWAIRTLHFCNVPFGVP